jgi:SHS2 domain-containing protein
MMDDNNYFDHEADIGIIGRGPTLEAAFENAAQNTFAIMANPSTIEKTHSITLHFQETDRELALVTWLNLLIGHARAQGLIFNEFHLQKTEENQQTFWQGTAWGSLWQDNIERGVEVKGATLTMLKVDRVGDQWDVRCVVDV